jgi:hypothetical protein
MAVLQIPLRANAPVVAESAPVFRAQPRFGLPIWDADLPAPRHAEPLDQRSLGLMVLAFSLAERPA